MDRAFNNRSASQLDPLAPRDVRQFLSQAQWIEANQCGKTLSPECLKKFAASSLDIVLQLGCKRVHEEVCHEEQLSLWFSRLAGKLETIGGLALISLIAAQPLIEVTVEELDACSCEIRRRSIISLIPHSLYRSEARIYWKLASVLLQELRALAAEREDANIRPAAMAPPLSRSAATESRSTAASITDIGRRLAARGLRHCLGRDSWGIGIRRRRSWTAADYYAPDLSGFVMLPCPITSFCADPFLLEYDGRHFVLFEEVRRAARQGVIACMEVFDDLHVAEPQVVLRRPYHLSYPFVIREHDELFMLPETGSKGTVELYRCVDFPDRWVLDTVLLEGFAGIDNTVVKRDGRFWLFSCRYDGWSDTWDELHIFWATSLRGPWRRHKLNPVLSDVRRARGAGQFLEVDGQLFRPSQDASKRYGLSINLNRVLLLSDTEYKEEVVSVMEGTWGLVGCHTWNADSKFEVVDGRIWIPRWAALRPGRDR